MSESRYYQGERLLDFPGLSGDPIDGIVVKPLKRIPDERGTIFHMMRSDDDIFEQFGEIYFSLAYPGVIKGWHIHKEITLHYAIVQGMIKLVIYDDREKSITRGNMIELFTGQDNYCLVKIPPLIWNGYKCIGVSPALVANCATIPHDPGEMDRLDPFSDKIGYDWDIELK